MDDFLEDDPDPLDLDGDGDHIIDMCMLFDEDKQNRQPSRGGCLGMVLVLASPGVFFLLRSVLS